MQASSILRFKIGKIIQITSIGSSWTPKVPKPFSVQAKTINKTSSNRTDGSNLEFETLAKLARISVRGMGARLLF